MIQKFKVTYKPVFSDSYRELVFPNAAQLSGGLFALFEFGVSDVKIDVL